MSKVLKVLSLSFLLCLSLVVAPFHISANGSLSEPFVGYNVYIYDTDSSTYVTAFDVDLDMSGLQFTCSNMQSSGGCMTYRQSGSAYNETGSITVNSSRTNSNTIYKADLILNGDYVGYVNVTAFGTTKNWYVNGNMITFTWTDGQSTSQTVTVNSYSLNKMEDGSRWIYPIESYNFIDSFFKQGFEQKPLVQYNDYYFPSFALPQNTRVWATSFDNDLIMVFAIDKYLTATTFDRYFQMEDGFTVTYENINYLRNVGGYNSGRIVKYTFHRTDGVYSSFYLDYIGSDAIIMPIFCNYSAKYVSTDFALQFGLKNPLLETLDQIANGTSSSVSSQTDLNQKTDDLTQSSSQLVTQEDTFNNDMNSALQNIDTDYEFGSKLGSKFIASADWVKTVYDHLTGNTPFGSVISFSLLVGLALLLMGKVFK